MENKFTKENFLQTSAEVLQFQLQNLYPVKVEKDISRLNLVFLNHDRNFSTFLTIRDLVKHDRVADIYTLSRSMFESIISMGLLSKCLIEEDIERYQNYQYIEIYKTYNHLKELGHEHMSGVQSSEFEFINKKREVYIKKWGKNSQSWTGKNLLENVKTIDNNYPSTCNNGHFYEYLYCQVYRRGSPATHSSFGGLSKGVNIEQISIPEKIHAQRFKVDEGHLIFSCFHSLLVFLSSVRFLGHLLGKKETEDYFQKITRYIISEN